MLPSHSGTLGRVVPALLFLLLAALPDLGRAQEVGQDTVAPPNTPRTENLTAEQTDTLVSAYRPSKSPGTAMLLSALLPGAGQVYNESYWKVPIVVGFGVYLLSNWLDNNRRYQDYKDQYEASLGTVPGGDEALLNSREFYKDQRDAFSWYLLIWYFVTLADAYVDASLYDFNVGSDLSIRTLPVVSPVPARAIQLNLRFRF